MSRHRADTPGWNASTMMLRTLHSRMTSQGWHNGDVPEIPCHACEPEKLPRRPLDLGVGWWR